MQYSIVSASHCAVHFTPELTYLVTWIASLFLPIFPILGVYSFLVLKYFDDKKKKKESRSTEDSSNSDVVTTLCVTSLPSEMSENRLDGYFPTCCILKLKRSCSVLRGSRKPVAGATKEKRIPTHLSSQGNSSSPADHIPWAPAALSAPPQQKVAAQKWTTAPSPARPPQYLNMHMCCSQVAEGHEVSMVNCHHVCKRHRRILGKETSEPSSFLHQSHRTVTHINFLLRSPL